MTNRQIFDDLDNTQWLLAIQELGLRLRYNSMFDMAMWLNDNVDEYFWFDRLEILHLDKEKYCG